jgi:hypothetical protein
MAREDSFRRRLPENDAYNGSLLRLYAQYREDDVPQKLYSLYIRNFDRAQEKLALLKKTNPAFAEFLKARFPSLVLL